MHIPTANTITVDAETSSSIIKQISLGTLQPSSSLTKTIFLRADGHPGDRILDVSIQSRLHPTSASSGATQSDEEARPNETIRTVTIPCVRPIGVAFGLERHPPKEPVRELLALDAFEEGEFDKEGEVLLTSRFDLLGAWDLEVESVVFHPGVSCRTRTSTASVARSPSPA